MSLLGQRWNSTLAQIEAGPAGLAGVYTHVEEAA
jgi:hypothetical protein